MYEVCREEGRTIRSACGGPWGVLLVGQMLHLEEV